MSKITFSETIELNGKSYRLACTPGAGAGLRELHLSHKGLDYPAIMINPDNVDEAVELLQRGKAIVDAIDGTNKTDQNQENI